MTEELQSASLYLFTHWKRIMPFRLLDWDTGREVTPDNRDTFHCQSFKLYLNDKWVGSFSWKERELKPKEIRALSQLDFETLEELIFEFDLDAQGRSGFFVLPPNLSHERELYQFGKEKIESFFEPMLPQEFHGSVEEYSEGLDGCALDYNVTIHGTPSTAEEIKKLGNSFRRIGELKGILVPSLKRYVQARKALERQIRSASLNH
ncbi:hypothetical protein J4447_03210 [Candidatus Pacearchaeota archaeon]|nr:hypothetical protein [Candidatus Pacearchaeota archaeon]